MNHYIQVQTAEGNFNAYLARPAVLPAPVIVVVQEIFGVNADVRDTCDELAARGYFALSPDLFWRMEPGVDMSDQTEAEWQKGFALYAAFDYDTGVADIEATMQAARSLPGATGKVGLLGYCLGGLMTFLTTARRGASASVVFYGGNTEKHLDEAAAIKRPLLIHLGEEDEYIPKDAQNAIIAALAGNPLTEVFVYPGCCHAFARHRGIHYDKNAAELANRRTAEFFNFTSKEFIMSSTHNTAKTQFAAVNGIHYAYRQFGCGNRPPLVCLQHFRGGLDNWDPGVTDGLADGGPVILFNNAGIASSGGEPADTIAAMAHHVVAFVDALGLTKIDLLGFSMGGFVAQQVSLDRPNLVRRLILAGTGPEGGEDMATYSPEVARPATQEVPTEDNFLYLFFEPTPSSQAAGRAFWLRRNTRVDQDRPSSLAAMAAQATAIGAWGTVPANARYKALKAIEQPTLVVNGKHDLLVPTVNSYILQQHLPNATLIIYPDSGHGAIFQFADAFVREANRFLNT